jgi:prepilin-type N-terminal cleavage/methylation domain-containing protein
MTTGRDGVRERAYTLAEMVVVVLVLAIAAAIVIGSIGTTKDAQAISAARVLASDVELARNLAVTTQAPHTVLFSSDLQSYKVVANYTGGGYALATAVAHPVRGNELFVVTLASLNGMESVVVGPVSFGVGGETYVTFDAEGVPSNGGSVTLQSGGTRMVISVETLTGAVSVARTAE